MCKRSELTIDRLVRTMGVGEGFGRFDRVLGAQIKSLKPSASDRVLSLLAVHFEPSEHPSGYVTLTFSGDASIRLQVECIEAELTDLGPAWKARSKPRHPGGEPGSADA